METFPPKNKYLQKNKESCNIADFMVDSKLKQLKINRENPDLSKGDEIKSDIKVVGSNQRLLRFGSVVLPSSAKTPRPPSTPKSSTFCHKVTHNRLRGDGEACEELGVENEQIDYCCVERLPGDGCFSECAEDDVDSLSDGYYEDELEESIDDINDETCSEGIL